MAIQNPHLTTLEQALKIVGDKKRLAAALKINVEELEIYMRGTRPLPVPLFNDALNLVVKAAR